MKNTLYAALTCDVVDSSKLGSKDRKKLEDSIWSLLEHRKLPISREWFEFSRGDSFQMLVEHPGKAMAVAIYVRAFLKSLLASGKKPLIDGRIAIGIGTIDAWGKTLGSSDGQALRLSGKGLDEIQHSEQRLTIQYPGEGINKVITSPVQVLDYFVTNWNIKHAEVLTYKLIETLQVEWEKSVTYRQIAERVGVTEGAVRKRVETSHWDQVSLLLEMCRETVQNDLIWK